MNYANFGCDFVDSFRAGFSAITQDLTTSYQYWYNGSLVLTTQVNYGIFSGACNAGFLVGLSAVTQLSTTSFNGWGNGSYEHTLT